MTDQRITRLAHILCDYCLNLQPGDLFAISGSTAAEPLAAAVYERALERGAHPHVALRVPGLDEIYLREASDEQLDFVSPYDRLPIETFQALLTILSDTNTRNLSGIDPARQARRAQSRRDLIQTYMQRSASGALRWNICQFPTNAHAQDADMSLRDYEDFVYGACLTDDPDPVARWQEVAARQQRLVEWLKGKERLEVRGPNIDLRLSIAGRSFLNDNGRHNMPGGEVFTSPVEDSVEGWVKFTFPAVAGGREVEGIELVFEHGRVVKATARKNEEFLIQTLDTDEGARRLGEFAIGANRGIQRFTRNILFDEKIGGTVHMAVGAGFPEAGGVNLSSVHWDIVCDMRDGGEIRVDDVLFYKAGEFLI
jgi:aminopeptidase